MPPTMRLHWPVREPEVAPDGAQGGHRSRRVRPTWRLLLLVVLMILAANLLLLGRRLGPVADVLGLSETSGDAPTEAIDRFFDRYVDPDGRVIRLDQGGDTVSEGQAYAMLLAVAQGDEGRFRTVWSWTREHLERPNGLLAVRWADGEVVDQNPAADADLDAARALVLAAERFDSRAYLRHGVRMAEALLRAETATADGDPILLAGPWARQQRLVVNPSYYDPRAFGSLERVTEDRRWGGLRSAGYELLDGLTDRAPGLPPDWAEVTSSGEVSPRGVPGEPGTDPRFGLDAVRVLVRFGADCDERGRRIAARAWTFFEDRDAEDLVLSYELDGEPATDAFHPTMVVAAAGAAHGAGDERSAADLLDAAEALEGRRPSYYGAAWVALGRVMLETDRLGPCPA